MTQRLLTATLAVSLVSVSLVSFGCDGPMGDPDADMVSDAGAPDARTRPDAGAPPDVGPDAPAADGCVGCPDAGSDGGGACVGLPLGSPPELTRFRQFVVDGIDGTLGGNTSGQSGAGTLFNDTTLIERLALRGHLDLGIAANYGYGFSGAKSTNAYGDHSWQPSRSVHRLEPIAVGNDFYIASRAGTTGTSTPAFNNATKWVSTTTDGTVEWTYGGNVVTDHAGNTTSWDDTGNRSHTSRLVVGPLNRFSSFFYDFGGVCLHIRRYLEERSLGTPADLDLLDLYATYNVDLDFGFRNTAPNYRNRSGAWGYYTNAEGFFLDHAFVGPRYVGGTSVITVENLRGMAMTGQTSGRNGSPLPAAAASEVEVPFIEGLFARGEVLQESWIREMSYSFRRYIAWMRARALTDRSAEFPNVRLPDGTTMPMPQLYLGILLEHFHKIMAGTEETPSGYAPFMVGLASHTLIEYYELERSLGRDPNRHVNSSPLNSEYTFSWSTSSPHGMSRAWPTIEDALEDTLHWMHTASTHSSGASMWQPDSFGAGFGEYVYRRQDALGAGRGALGGLIAHAFAWVALRRFAEGGGVTSWAPADFVAAADDVFEGALLGFDLFGTGKALNQLLSYSVDYLDHRNALSCRLD